MIFETKTLKTKNRRKTTYGIISLIFFAISSIVVFVLGPKEGMLDKDYLALWFGTYKKAFLLLNLVFYINGVVLMALANRRNYKAVGKVRMTDEAIEITEPTETIVFPVAEIETIQFKYYGYKSNSFWIKEGSGNAKGNTNYLTLTNLQKTEYTFEFFLGSYADKKSIITQLESYQEKGVKIKVEYLYPYRNYPNDIDFVKLKILDRWYK